MSNARKSQSEILDKLGIAQLNPMQLEAQAVISKAEETILLSPTGTGKTLAFLLPIVANLDSDCDEVQALILAPSRELAIQIEQVAREMGSGFRIQVVYGGRPVAKDRAELATLPALLIGTPGRVADHLRRPTFSGHRIQTLVLDEFDKSLEIGFEDEMAEIMDYLPHLRTKVLTSATQDVKIPDFVGIQRPKVLNFLEDGVPQLRIKRIISPSKDKLQTLVDALAHLGNHPGIVFCNFKDSIQRVSEFLEDHDIAHGCFHGSMEQKDRERALIKFRNGTHQLLLATDLAARGIDVPEIRFIVHYHLPLKEAEFTHRNGRTARMNSDGTAYVLQWMDEYLPEFIDAPEVEELQEAQFPKAPLWSTLFVSGGRKDKISKGDLAGLFFKQGGLEKHQLGTIELKTDCAFVAVHGDAVDSVLPKVDQRRLKKKKVRVYPV